MAVICTSAPRLPAAPPASVATTLMSLGLHGPMSAEAAGLPDAPLDGTADAADGLAAADAGTDGAGTDGADVGADGDPEGELEPQATIASETTPMTSHGPIARAVRCAGDPCMRSASSRAADGGRANPRTELLTCPAAGSR